MEFIVQDALKASSNKTEDDFVVEGTDIHMNVHFLPDFIMKDGSPATSSYQVRNPFFLLEVYRNDKLIFDGIVPYNGTADAGDYKVSFPEVRRWVEMEFVGEPGIGFFFMMSFIGLAGVAVRVMDPDERIYIILKDAENIITATSYVYSKHFSGLINDRRDEIMSCIKGSVKSPE